MKKKRVGCREWVDVCSEWRDNLAHMCVYAWQTDRISGGKVRRLRGRNISIGKSHLVLQLPKLLWSHLRIDPMYFFAR